MKKIAYIVSDQLIKECNRIPPIKKRASMVDELIRSYGLHKDMLQVEPKLADKKDLLTIHSSLYVDYLKDSCSGAYDPEDDTDNADSDSNYGIGYDCPKITNLYELTKIIAGSTLAAADMLIQGFNIAINWHGGWHHAQRDEAEGFCYVNDIGIGIQRLRSKFDKILYIDLDVHHGNGVENAFNYSKHVFTVSFHQYEPGYFPGTGNENDCGFGSGKGYTVNFPYKSYITGELFFIYFKKTIDLIIDKFKPDVLVLQCGGDAIVGDPLGETNLTPYDIGCCIKHILSWNINSMFLGGGGYNLANTSRYWTYLTGILCSKELDNDIPENDYFPDYGPDYELEVTRKNVPDPNKIEEFERIFQKIKGQL